MNFDRSHKGVDAMIGTGAVNASFLGAAPHFLPLAICPLLVAAASYGGLVAGRSLCLPVREQSGSSVRD